MTATPTPCREPECEERGTLPLDVYYPAPDGTVRSPLRLTRGAYCLPHAAALLAAGDARPLALGHVYPLDPEAQHLAKAGPVGPSVSFDAYRCQLCGALLCAHCQEECPGEGALRCEPPCGPDPCTRRAGSILCRLDAPESAGSTPAARLFHVLDLHPDVTEHLAARLCADWYLNDADAADPALVAAAYARRWVAADEYMTGEVLAEVDAARPHVGAAIRAALEEPKGGCPLPAGEESPEHHAPRAPWSGPDPASPRLTGAFRADADAARARLEAAPWEWRLVPTVGGNGHRWDASREGRGFAVVEDDSTGRFWASLKGDGFLGFHAIGHGYDSLADAFAACARTVGQPSARHTWDLEPTADVIEDRNE